MQSTSATEMSDKQLADTGRRFMWTGIFAQKVGRNGATVMVPMCGNCGDEAQWSEVRAAGHCPVCIRDYFTGPVYLKNQLSESMKDIDRRLTAWEAWRLTVPESEAARVAGRMTVTGPLSSDSSHEAPPPYIMKDGGVEAPAPRPTSVAGMHKALRTNVMPWHTSSRSTLPSVPIPPVVQDSIERVDSWLDPHSAGVSEGAPWEEDWEAEPRAESTEGAASVTAVPAVTESVKAVVPEVEQRVSPPVEQRVSPPGEQRVSPPVSVLSLDVRPRSSVYQSPHTQMVNDESTFWVLPGKAQEKEFRAVSRVQKNINLEISKKWGFYMPYAPEYVFDEIEKNLEKWVRQDILSYLKLDEYSLVHPDGDTRRRAKDLLEETVPMWWQGRTVLRHYVRSVTKHTPERHLSVDVPLEGGGTVEKPHPRYYISFVNTKNWFRLPVRRLTGMEA
ncbi:hypothetical protein XELAEV_18003925mg [Xenopus laevis]|uniref:Uncharacterized protein n=1 Tax=Xenopus laevis TaxID=8355 RepID=A0A974BPT4_XENLA|nr:hypothetical protein XELAEV_18003925mg [Xenopus laevis]